MIREEAALEPEVRDEVLALLAGVEERDGVAAVGEEGLLELRAPRGRAIHLLSRAGDVLAGYAWTDGTTAEVAVAPEWRRRGHGTALVLRALRDPGVAVWAHGTLPAAVALAGRLGLTATRELWRMAWEGGDVVVPPLPDDLTVRGFRGGDEDAWVALNARVFAGHPEQGRWTVADFAARAAEPWFDAADLLLVEHGRELVAYAWLKRVGGEAEVYVLAVAPEQQRRGVAAHLLARLESRAAAAGARGLTLHVEGDNLTAIRSYERSGFRHDSTDTQFMDAARGGDSDR